LHVGNTIVGVVEVDGAGVEGVVEADLEAAGGGR
jgi:hypothetical protein